MPHLTTEEQAHILSQVGRKELRTAGVGSNDTADVKDSTVESDQRPAITPPRRPNLPEGI